MNFADRDQVSFKASKHPSFALELNFEAISTLQRSHRIQNFRCLLYLRQSLCPSCLKGRMSNVILRYHVECLFFQLSFETWLIRFGTSEAIEISP